MARFLSGCSPVETNVLFWIGEKRYHHARSEIVIVVARGAA